MSLTSKLIIACFGLLLVNTAQAADPAQAGAGKVWHCRVVSDHSYYASCVLVDHAALPWLNNNNGSAATPVDTMDEYLMTADKSAQAGSTPAAGGAWNIPLYSQPFSSQDVIEVLRSALCGPSATCAISIDG